MTTLALAVLVALAALGGGRAHAQTTVKVGDLGLISDAPFYVAMERGYFKERGLDVQFERFASAAPAMAHVSTGEVQVVGGGISPALFNGFARGFSIKVVASRTREVPGRTINGLVVRADLKDQLQKIADLKGRKVAVNAAGSALVYVLGRMLESEGLTLKDVDLVTMPFPDMGTALTTRAIDAAVVAEPFLTQFEEKGLGRIAKRTSDVIRNPFMELAVIFYNADWAKKNPQAARDFMVAYLKGARDFEEAAARGRTRAEVVDALVKHTTVKDRALYDRMQWSFADPNGAVTKESIREQQDWYAKDGKVAKKVDPDEMIDDQFARHAVQQLGPYSPRVR